MPISTLDMTNDPEFADEFLPEGVSFVILPAWLCWLVLVLCLRTV